MVGLSDIPCVGKIVDRISDAAVDTLFRGFSYMFFYKDHVKVLNTEIQKLNTVTDLMSRKVGEKKDDGKIIIDGVKTWQTEVEEIKKSAEEFLEKYKNRSSWRCIQCMPIPKPVSRFRLGRDAVQKAKRVTELSLSAKDLLADEIAYLSRTNAPLSDTVYQTFESRTNAYDKLWEELVTKGGSLVLGIYGMPGVGKTQMVERISKEALAKKIFNKVTRVDVGSEKLDVFKLQTQLAGYLDCHLNAEDDENHRASQLTNCIMNVDKILIILDDLWWEIPLHRIGIPLGDGDRSNNCKILLTSRKKKVCMDNKCLHPVKIAPLEFGEAWKMFRNTVVADNIPDESLAQEVCKKCAGLPLLINAVGKALKFTSHGVWKDALDQLEKGNFEKIADIDPKVYACVKLSIDKLDNDAKSCLILCSLYPEDAEIYIKKLIALATGSQLVRDGEARICAMVEILRSSSLLLESEDHILKVHDLIRDVARSIAVQDPKYSFSLGRCGSRLPDDVDYSTRKLLHLHLEKNDIMFPDGLVCPYLHSLWIQCNKHRQQFSGGFFGMFVNLRFLLIEDMHFSLEPQFSLKPLVNLRTLILDGCDMTHISQTSASFFPENLETLCIWNCNLPDPLDLPILKHLRKLEIQGWEVPMMQNSISSCMPDLEELHIPCGFRIPDDGCETSRDTVSEISKLTKLKSLQMSFDSKSERFQDTNIFDNLLEYHIYVGANNLGPLLDRGVAIKRSVEFEYCGLEQRGLRGLTERAQVVKLLLAHINGASIYNSNREAFADLQKLKIKRCDDVEYIARIIPHEEIQPHTSFSKLTNLKIKGCDNMKYLFNNYVARCLVQLQRLGISDCAEMEAIIMNEGTSDGDDNDIINFSKLKSLKLIRIPSLKSFSLKNTEMHWQNSAIPGVHTPTRPLSLFDGMVAFPSLEVVRIWNSGVTDIWGKHDNNNDKKELLGSPVSFSKLKVLDIFECNELESVVPLVMLNKLRDLEFLSVLRCKKLRNVFQHSSLVRDLIHLYAMNVRECEMMTHILGGEGEQEEKITDYNDGIILFPELAILRFCDLKCLSSFWHHPNGEANTYKVHFPKLVDFYVYECGGINLEVIELGRNDSLRILDISCANNIQLPLEWQLQLYNLESLTLRRYFWWNELKFQCFKRLKVLTVKESGCSTMFSFSAFESLQQLQQLRISKCASLEEIVEDGEPSGTKKRTVRLLQLKSVTLEDLPNLKSFFHGANYRCQMPALEDVEVDNCGFSTLFTTYVFRTLQQLDDLRVKNCRILEDIVEEERDAETFDTNGKIITLPQLSRLDLEDLPNLKSFCSTSSYVFNMPKLVKFFLRRCPQMENFTSLKTSRPLVPVTDDIDDIIDELDDL